jgi:hypothetical protein
MPTKTEIKAAQRAINEQLDLIDDIRRQDGNREAMANATYHDTVRRMSRAIATLKAARAEVPARLTINWSHYKAIGWHNDFTLPNW